MDQRRIGVIVNGATGRMGRNQHLMGALVAIRNDGGLALADGTRLVPEPFLVGRDPGRLRTIAEAAGLDRWTTDLDEALADPEFPIYFDAVSTGQRAGNIRRALDAGKHVYAEKPMALGLAEAEALLTLATERGVKTGIVSDKLWTPGISKLLSLVESGFFGRILMVRIEGGHWVFEDAQPPQRPSWNYKKAGGGGVLFDMLPHYAYILEAIAGPPLDVVCHADTLVKQRRDESGQDYPVDVEDTCLSISRLPGGALAQVMNSWAVRVRRDDVIVVQVDGMDGSAVAGLTHCWVQPRERTTRALWNRDITAPIDYFKDWERVPDAASYPNPYRVQWEAFLRHVAEDAPFPWSFEAGVRTVQFSAECEQSWRERRWIDLPGATRREPAR